MNMNNNKKQANVIVLPEYDELATNVKILHEEFLKLVCEYDELLYVIIPNIKEKYLLTFGALEYKVYKAECSYLRLKRKMELLQIQKNRQEKVDLKKIELILNQEFKEYKVKLEEQLTKINKALKRSELDCLSAEDVKLLKTLYRNIVKLLHPDLNPNITETQLELFHRATEAYKNSDLFVVKVINELVMEEENSLEDNSIVELKKEKERLEKLIEGLTTKKAFIKESFPYNKIDLLEDDQAILNYKEQLDILFKSYMENIGVYRTKLRKMLR